MSSLLEGLRHCTSHCTFVQTVTGSRRALSRARKYHSNPCAHASVMFVFTNGNWKFVFISSVLFTEEGDIEQNKETK